MRDAACAYICWRRGGGRGAACLRRPLAAFSHEQKITQDARRFVYRMRDDIEFNIEFCELIEQYPNIYDYTKTGYSNRNVQDKIWQEIAIKVGATGMYFI
ncbi:unnamed protein product [Spodoptera littoralis]|uniref:MADF domain-containing protein n=1 Tax=Spodoptera littoralis TaxID=7109 RepID=A0A9P0I804_SPOLI|nr:unnamed protein product [Spodoptera littoralis]CAH1643162.1 unnamed protein product [Spodoptera littoralis]